MKYFFRGHRLVLLSVLLGMLCTAAVSVYASTTIGTDISTGGTLTASSTMIGPAVSTLDPSFGGWTGNNPILLTGKATVSAAAPIGAQSQSLSLGIYFATLGQLGFEQDLVVNPDSELFGYVQNINSVVDYNGQTLNKVVNYQAYAPQVDGGSAVSLMQFYTQGVGGLATNAYSFWDDSPGVFRIKDDNTFNGVYQAIPALYNPQFTQYTPGATNYERAVLGQWNSNVAEIGPEAGGTGTLRPLRLLGSSVLIPNNVGIGTTTPQSKLQVTSGANATTTVTVGDLGLTTSKGCVNMNRSNGQPASFYINAAGTMIVETNYCR